MHPDVWMYAYFNCMRHYHFMAMRLVSDSCTAMQTDVWLPTKVQLMFLWKCSVPTKFKMFVEVHHEDTVIGSVVIKVLELGALLQKYLRRKSCQMGCVVKSCSGSGPLTILGTSRSKVQQPIVDCTRAQILFTPCPSLSALGWCILLLYTSAEDGLGPLQWALVVLPLPWISSKYLSPACAVGFVCNLC